MNALWDYVAQEQASSTRILHICFTLSAQSTLSKIPFIAFTTFGVKILQEVWCDYSVKIAIRL